MSIYSCFIYTFKCDFTEWGYLCVWRDKSSVNTLIIAYFDKSFLTHFTKDWNEIYFKSSLTLARNLNALGDRLELLPSVCIVTVQALS